jgi:hypothetical protein
MRVAPSRLKRLVQANARHALEIAEMGKLGIDKAGKMLVIGSLQNGPHTLRPAFSTSAVPSASTPLAGCHPGSRRRSCSSAAVLSLG